MSDQPPSIEPHRAYDRFGKVTLRMAHDLTAALADSSQPEDESPIVVRTDGPHRTIDGLAALIDEALADNALADGARPEEPGAAGASG